MGRTYSVITHAGDGLDHEVLDEKIRHAFGAESGVTGFVALCAVWITPETDLAGRSGVRCLDCLTARSGFDPPLEPRSEPRDLAIPR